MFCFPIVSPIDLFPQDRMQFLCSVPKLPARLIIHEDFFPSVKHYGTEHSQFIRFCLLNSNQQSDCVAYLNYSLPTGRKSSSLSQKMSLYLTMCVLIFISINSINASIGIMPRLTQASTFLRTVCKQYNGLAEQPCLTAATAYASFIKYFFSQALFFKNISE